MRPKNEIIFGCLLKMLILKDHRKAVYRLKKTYKRKTYHTGDRDVICYFIREK